MQPRARRLIATTITGLALAVTATQAHAGLEPDPDGIRTAFLQPDGGVLTQLTAIDWCKPAPNGGQECGSILLPADGPNQVGIASSTGTIRFAQPAASATMTVTPPEGQSAAPTAILSATDHPTDWRVAFSAPPAPGSSLTTRVNYLGYDARATFFAKVASLLEITNVKRVTRGVRVKLRTSWQGRLTVTALARSHGKWRALGRSRLKINAGSTTTTVPMSRAERNTVRRISVSFLPAGQRRPAVRNATL